MSLGHAELARLIAAASERATADFAAGVRIVGDDPYAPDAVEMPADFTTGIERSTYRHRLAVLARST